MSTLNTESKIKITELIMVFIATLPMGVANIWITKNQNDEKLAFDRQNAKSILSIQNKELFIKSAEQGLNSQKLDIDFLRTSYEECQKDGELSIGKIKSYADAYYSSSEKKKIMIAKIQENCLSKNNNQPVDNQDKPTYNIEHYKSLGFEYLQNKKFLEAAESFSQATQMTPVDASLWNQKAYAQFRAGNYTDAMNSISIALRIGSDSDKVRKYMAINAAKILCAKGDVDNGRNYIQQSINAIPDLMPMAKKDLELGSTCKIDLSK
ncbi:tetratricopeptide repeat protein [Pantoea rwandensis]|uniref:Tetratricopeptide repeat protein n=1 Tax=Pantoea rwandensis TaxID=1076550 RepID=A0ABM5RKW9_9GAMM|nr:tetratricopeptide repeat protein [Pantoea rwandensis]AIR86579.1 hypothetical protein LH22_14355 [Pantoea rwandensis]